MSAIEAVEMNQLDVLKEIIKDSPIEMNKTDPKGKTLLALACENGFDKIVEYIVKNNDSLISMETMHGLYPVHFAARYNHIGCLNILYEYGASLQPKSNEGQTPLHLAALWGHLEVVKWLIMHKANFNIIDDNKETAYDLAKKLGHVEVANFLARLSGKPLVILGQSHSDNHPSSKKAVYVLLFLNFLGK